MTNTDTLEKLLYSQAEASALLNVSESTIRRLVARGELKRVRGIGRCRIPRKEIERFIEDSSKESKFNIKLNANV